MGNKKTYLTLLSVMLFVVASNVTAYSFDRKNDLRIIKITQRTGDALLSKATSLYSKKQYGAALMELDHIVSTSVLSRERRATVDFLSTICKSKLMKENTQDILRGYINRANNSTLTSIAMLELAQELILLDNIAEASELFNNINEKYLDRSHRQDYRFYKAYIDLYLERNDDAYNGFESCTELSGDRANQAKYMLGYIDYLRGDIDKAYGRFEEVSTLKGYENVNLYMLQIKFLKGDFAFVLEKGQTVLTMPLDANTELEVKRLIGESNFNLGNYTNAVKWIEQYKNEGGEMNRELHYQMGYSYYMQNMFKDAVSHFSQIISGSDALAQNAYYHLADAYLKTGNRSGAMRAFSMAASFDYEKKITEDALYNYARMTYESTDAGLYTQKIAVLKRYVNEYGSTSRSNEIRSYLLSLYLNSSNYDAAMYELSRVKNPNNDIKMAVQRLCYNKGAELFALRDYNGAIQQFNKSLNYNISAKFTSLARFWKAESMFKMGNYSPEVIRLYEQYMSAAQSSFTEYKMAQYNIGYIYFNGEQWNKSVEAFDKFIKNYKTSDKFLSDAYVRMADAHFAQRSYQQAKNSYIKAIELNDVAYDYAQLQVAVSEGLMNRNDLKVMTLKNILEGGKSSYIDQVTIELASTYNKMGEFDLSAKLLEKMTTTRSKSPYTPSAILELGVAYVNAGEEDKALNSYKKLIEKYSSSSEAQDAMLAVKSIYVSRGDVEPYFAYVKSIGKEGGVDDSERESLRYDALQRQFIAGNHEKVIESADLYRNEFPYGKHYVDVTYYLSEALAFKNYDRADVELKAMMDMELNQYTISSLHTASKYYTRRSQHDNVLRCYNEIYTLSDNASERRDMLDLIMEQTIKLGDSKQITDAAQLVMQDNGATNKTLSLAQFAIGRQKYDKGEWDEAITLLMKSNIPLSKAEGVQARFLLADAKFKSGDINGSEKAIIDLSNSDTPHQYWVARAFILYGDIYASKGDLFQAKATYQSIIEGYGKLTDGIIKTAEKRVEALSTKDDKIESKEEVKEGSKTDVQK